MDTLFSPKSPDPAHSVGTGGKDKYRTREASGGLGTQIMFWKPGDTSVSDVTALQITNNRAASRFRGSVFTVPDTSVSDRVYKIEAISYGEDGLINISASFSPLNADDTLAVMNLFCTRYYLNTYDRHNKFS